MKLESVVVIGVLIGLVVCVDYSYVEEQVQEQQRGPTRWGDIVDTTTGTAKYDSCKYGATQSPIDISQHHEDSAASYALSGLSSMLSGNGVLESFQMVHDSAQVSLIASGPQFNSAALTKIEFRSPSDHSFGGGKRDFELQLHFGSASSTTVVAVTGMSSTFGTNEELHKVFEHIPSSPGIFTDANTKDVSGSTFNIFNVLPASRQYATYTGSLSYPPCTPGMKYYVFLEPIVLGEAQLHLFRQRAGFNNTATANYVFRGNSRPLQNQLPIEFFLDESVESGSYTIPSGSNSEQTTLERSIIAVILGILSLVVSFKAIQEMLKYSSKFHESANGNLAASQAGESSSSKYVKK